LAVYWRASANSLPCANSLAVLSKTINTNPKKRFITLKLIIYIVDVLPIAI
jgi:hypothetical protein